MTLAIAFAVLQIEPPGHLGRVTELRAKDELRQDNSRKPFVKATRRYCGQAGPLTREAAAGTKSGKAAIDNMTETPIPTPKNEEVVEAQRKRSIGGASCAEGTDMMTLRLRVHDFHDGPQRAFSGTLATSSDVFIQASSRTERAGVSHSLEVMSLRGAMAIRSGGSEFADLHD